MSARLEFAGRHLFAGGFALDASFESDAAVTALFGPSGSGKSTILAIVAGLLRAHRARVRLGERVLVDDEVDVVPERRGVGFVMQDPLLFPHLDVAANLRYGMQRRARTRAARSRIGYERVVDVLELGRLTSASPGELSGGERQRVALGRALLSAPELLLLDEPLVGLEEDLRDRVLGYVERVAAEWRIPMLIVTHDQVVVRRLAETVVVLESGRVRDVGDALTTLDRAVLAAGGSNGPVNLLRATDVALRPASHASTDSSTGSPGGGWRGRWIGRIGDQELQLPAESRRAGETVHVRFLASDVALARGDVSGLSMRNHVRGRIETIEAQPEAERAFVAVRVGTPGHAPGAGQRLWAELTLDAVGELGLASGVDVVCFVKTRAMRVSS